MDNGVFLSRFALEAPLGKELASFSFGALHKLYES